MNFRRGRLSVLAFQLAVPAAALLVGAQAGYAQTFRGSISGTVVDASGAAIPNAQIELLEIATGTKHTTTSSSAGEYSFPDLPLGNYTITATQAGFSTVKVDRVPVSAGVVYNQSITMTVAQTSQTVEVSAAGISLDTTSTTQTTVLPSATVQNTPMNGRDFTQLIALTPGFGGYSAGGFGSVNGSRANQVNWQIDGSDNNDLWHNIPAVNQGGVSGIAGVTLPLDSIEQFSEQTESSAEAGRNPGGTVNLVTKSGTNQIHGSVYYYNRNEALAASSPFSPGVKNKLRNQQYGASLGGPFLRNKFFWFWNYEKQQFIIESPASETEPSLDYQGQAKQVLSQYNVAVNPAMQNLLNTLWPSYALGGGATPNNYTNASPITGYSYNGVVKLDYAINEKNTLSGRGYGGQGSQVAPVGAPPLILPYYFEVAPIHVFNYSAVWNSMLTPRLTNQVVAGVNYFNQVFYDADHSFDLAALGFNTGVDNTILSGAPGLTISGFNDLGNATPPEGRNDITGHIDDAASFTVGKHELRFGGEYRNAQLDEFYRRKERGAFSFDGSQGPWSDPEAANNGVRTPCEQASGSSYNGAPPFSDTQTLALADFMAGCSISSSIVRGNTARQVFVNTYDLFLQDAWQLTPHLNVNYGIRYDYLGPLHNDLQNLSVFRPGLAGETTPGIAFQGVQISNLYDAAHDNVSPRVGFSWQPPNTEGIVLRGGFGVFFDEPNLNPFLDNRPPNGGASGAESNPAGSSPVAGYSATQQVIVPGQLLFPTDAVFAPYGETNGMPNASGTLQNSYALFSVNPNFRSSYNFNYNLNIEKSLGTNAVFTLGYVGMQARKELIIRDLNQPALGSTSLGTFGQNATRPYGAAFPYYSAINEIDSAGTANYNALQTTLRSTNWHGLTSQFSYTWSHGLDEMTQYRNTVPQNSFNLKGDYGNMDYDTRNNFTAYLNYVLPDGLIAGPHWLTHGWQLNSLLTFHGGQPFSVMTGTDSSGTGEGEDRGDQAGPVVAGAKKIVNTGSSYVYQYITNANFTAPNNAFGTTRRNQYYNPGFEDVDFSVFKDGHITERFTVQFRVEMFNLLNHTNLAPVDNSLADGTGFGQSTTTIGNYNGAPGIGPGEPFNTQLALKVIF